MGLPSSKPHQVGGLFGIEIAGALAPSGRGPLSPPCCRRHGRILARPLSPLGRRVAHRIRAAASFALEPLGPQRRIKAGPFFVVGFPGPPPWQRGGLCSFGSHGCFTGPRLSQLDCSLLGCIKAGASVGQGPSRYRHRIKLGPSLFQWDCRGPGRITVAAYFALELPGPPPH